MIFHRLHKVKTYKITSHGDADLDCSRREGNGFLLELQIHFDQSAGLLLVLDGLVHGVGVVGHQDSDSGDVGGLEGLVLLAGGGLVLALRGEAALHQCSL